MPFLWTPITDENSLKIIDELTVEFTLTKPFTPFISTLAAIYVVNPEVVKAHEVDGDWGVHGCSTTKLVLVHIPSPMGARFDIRAYQTAGSLGGLAE